MGVQEPSDGGTLDLDRANPAEAFSMLYRLLSRPVHGYLQARGVEDPEAVTQDVFVALYPRMAALHGGFEGAKTLIFSIAHARAVDHHRRREKVPVSASYDPEADRRTTASAYDASFPGDGLLELLQALPEDYREVLRLRVIADLSIEQTASIMSRTTGAVKQLQRRAIAGLKEQLLNREQGSE